MKYFLDTEFIEDGNTIDLISIALVCEDGRELYCESLEADLSKADDWVKKNVLPSLFSQMADKSAGNAWSRDGGRGGLLRRNEIKDEILRFIGDDSNPQFFAYFADYDWVVFCWLFGRMIDLPESFPMYCMDLKQMMKERGLTYEWKQLNCPQKDGHHNALEDARWNAKLYQEIVAYPLKQLS